MSAFSTYGINTFGLRHQVGDLRKVLSVQDLSQVLPSIADPIIVGGGSNILFIRNVERPLILIEINGVETVAENEKNTWVRVGAGTIWNDLVLWAVARDLGGIENLSLIPGKCGAAPMQNIGAYGVELNEVFAHLEGLDTVTGCLREFDKSECEFGYRDSIFKNELKEKFVITHITLKLTKAPYHELRTEYGAIRLELDKRKITHPSIKDLSDVIIDIRKSKLPDPSIFPNAGSFFKNPVISKNAFLEIASNYPNAPQYPVDSNNTKLPAGWLIEKCGWKGKRIGNVGTYPNQALVIVNYGVGKGQEILDFSEKVKAQVNAKFGIELEREVNVY